LAGLLTAEGDAVISVDADLQDDIGAIPRMIDRYTAVPMSFSVSAAAATATALNASPHSLFIG